MLFAHKNVYILWSVIACMDMWYFARICAHARSWREFAKCRFAHFPSFFSVHVDTYVHTSSNTTCRQLPITRGHDGERSKPVCDRAELCWGSNCTHYQTPQAPRQVSIQQALPKSEQFALSSYSSSIFIKCQNVTR